MSGPYCRVYWSIRTDERFAGIYNDDAALAAWLRLLIAAEGVYPAPADIPGWLRADVLELLADRGLIEIVDSWHYRVHGLESERERRSKAAKNAASARWSDRNASAYAPALLAEQSRDEQSRDEQGAGDADADPYHVYAALFGRPSVKVTSWMDDLTTRYGAKEVGDAIAQAVKDGIGRDRVMGVAESYLAERKRRALRAAKPAKPNPLRDQIKAALEAKYAEEAS